MATVIGDDTDIRVEFTALEIDLMREIAFNTNKNLDEVAAERLRLGITCEQPGEDVDYELRYTPEEGNTPLELNLDDEEAVKDDLFDRLKVLLTELYNVAWSRGVSATNGIDEEDRAMHVSSRVAMIIKEIER